MRRAGCVESARRLVLALCSVGLVCGAGPQALSAQAASAGAYGARAPVSAHAAQVEGLPQLEQKMGELQIHSLRFSALFDFGTLELIPKGGGFPFFLGGSGELSLSPVEGSFSLGLFGLTTETRLIGDTVYRYDESAGEHDGGRPWVRSTRKTMNNAVGISPTNIDGGQDPTLEATKPFAHLIEVFNSAASVLDGGPTVVEGQPVTEFEAPVNPYTVFDSKSQKVLALLEKFKVTAVKLDLFIAPDGLPVRTNYIVQAGPHSFTFTIDILAVNIPVSVQAPPADKTIDEAQLKKIEQRRRRAARRIGRCIQKALRNQRRRRHGRPRGVRLAPALHRCLPPPGAPHRSPAGR